MARLLVQATIPYDSGLPADVTVNTFAVDTATPGAPTPTQGVTIVGAVQDFYAAIDEFYSEHIGTSLTIRIYDIDDPEPRAPLDVITSPWQDTGGNPLPEEVALVLSFRGVYVSGSPQARRRGRIYIGPLNTTTLSEENGHAVPSTGLVNTLAGAGAQFGADLLAEGMLHCVWSRADDTLYPVQSYWVDNAWDTQRRRGVLPTYRAETTPLP